MYILETIAGTIGEICVIVISCYIGWKIYKKVKKLVKKDVV